MAQYAQLVSMGMCVCSGSQGVVGGVVCGKALCPLHSLSGRGPGGVFRVAWGVPSGVVFGWERTRLLRLSPLGGALVLARHSTPVDEQTADP